jgi:uncharacterized repeat protein (TIGR01451 family)
MSLVTCIIIIAMALPASAALLCSTPGKDGPGNLSGVVNTYYPGTASVGAGATSITLGSSSGASTAIAIGDLLLVIQMQDADINVSNDANYGGSGAGAGFTAMNQTGRYEFVKAASAVGTGGGTVNLASGLANSYRIRAASAVNGQSTFQVVRVPQYTTATVNAGNTLSPALWDGARGGIVAIDVAGALTINGRIEADGKGFRGGWGEQGGTTGPNTDYRTLATILGNGMKGEGTAGSPNRMNQPASFDGAPVLATTGTSLGYPDGANNNASKGRGAPGNAGGGGTDGNTNNDQNSGGGGGGNYGPGGKGGNSWNTNLDVGGEGGAAATISYNRIVMGGGGGAGTTNNGTADTATYSNPAGIACGTTGGRCSSGAPGGGIIILRAQSITGGSVSARGASAYNVENDSSGGGGAGGSVVLETQLGGSTSVDVRGGDGGNAWRSHTTTADRHGPGGGGSGGFVAYSPAAFSLSATTTGGANGKSCNSDAYGSGSSSGGIYAYQAPNVPGSEPGYLCQPSLSIAKSTLTPVVTAPGTATYMITVRNNGVATAAGVSISDMLPGSPAHFTNASATPAITYTPALCATRTATINPATGSATPVWGLWDMSAGCQMDITFNAAVPAGTIPAMYQNIASATYNGITISSNPFSTTAEDVAVRAPLAAAKSFALASIASGGQSTVTVTLSNSNPVDFTGVGFTDTLPAVINGAVGNMTMASPAGSATTCGGTPTYTATSGSFSVSGLTVPANNSCSVSFNVSATQAGIYVNTIPAGAVSGTISGNTSVSVAPATASLSVANPLLPPTISKIFLSNPILPGGTTTLRFTLTNPNPTIAIGSAGFADSLPTNLTVTSAAIVNSCGGTVTAVPGSASISLNTNGTIPANGSCTVDVGVTGTVPGLYQNTTSQVEGDTGTGNSATALLTIMAPLVVEKTFLTNPVRRSTATTLQLVLSNPNNVTVTGAAFLDSYPTGLLNSTPANASVTCTGGGSATLQGGGNGTATVGITNGSITAGNSCTVTVLVQAVVEGLYTNSSGVVTTTNAGTSPAAVAGLNVLAPPMVTKKFTPEMTVAGVAVTMTIVVENPSGNSIGLTGVTLLDTYPAGMTNAVAGAAPVCSTGASASLTTGTGLSGGASVGLDSGVIPPGGFCTITQQVVTTQDATNTTQTPTSANGGAGTAATAFLKVLKPLVVTKTFSNYRPAANTDFTMTITMTNPNPVAATTVGFTDSYPANMVNSTSNTASPSYPGGNCGAAAVETYTSGGGSLTFANGTIPANSSCTVTQILQITANGTYINTVNVTTGNVGSSSDTTQLARGNGNNTLVYFSKSFSPNPILPNGTTTLTFTITNPHSATASTIGFTDLLPAGVTATNATRNVCNGTNNLTITGGNLISMITSGTGVTAGSLTSGSSCTFSINTVTASNPGIYINTTGNISASTGTGTPAVASLSVFYPPTISKSFSDATIVAGGLTAMTIRLSNLNASAITTSAIMTDTLPTIPGGMTIAGTVSNNSCPFTPVDQANGAIGLGDTALRIPNGATIPVGGCEFTVNVTAITAGTYSSTIAAGALVTTAGSNSVAASASLNVVAVPPSVSKAFIPATIAAGGTSTLLVTLFNPNSVPIALTTALTDTLPSGVTATGNRATSCAGGTAGGAAGTLTLSSGASIPPGTAANPGSCTIQVDVTAASGIYTNTIPAAALTTNAGSNAAVAQAVLTVDQYAPPTVSKAFGAADLGTGMITTLTLTLTNNNPVAATLTANLDDTLPTIAGPGSMLIASPNGLAGSCPPGQVTATPGSGLLRYVAGATIPPGGCTIVVNVTTTAAGTYINTIAAGALQTTLGNSPGATSDTLTAISFPNITVMKYAFGLASGATGKPGEEIPYTISISHVGSSPSANVVVQDQLSPYVAWKLNSLTLSEGSPASGLTLTFPPTALYYSYNYGPWVATAPVSGGGGAPAGYDGTVTGIKVDLSAAGTMSTNNATFTINYRTLIK